MFELKGYTIKKWDKKEPINDVPAEEVLKSDKMYSRDVFIVQFKDITIQVQVFDIIRLNSLKYKDLPDDELMKVYLSDFIESKKEYEKSIEEAKTLVVPLSAPAPSVEERLAKMEESIEIILNLLQK